AGLHRRRLSRRRALLAEPVHVLAAAGRVAVLGLHDVSELAGPLPDVLSLPLLDAADGLREEAGGLRLSCHRRASRSRLRCAWRNAGPPSRATRCLRPAPCPRGRG